MLREDRRKRRRMKVMVKLVRSNRKLLEFVLNFELKLDVRRQTLVNESLSSLSHSRLEKPETRRLFG
jgi:hypothetical protein